MADIQDIGYTGISLNESLTIRQIVTIHYYEYMSDFYFSGESHDFWEFLCVDKGEIQVTAGDSLHILSSGDIIFHKPNEFHNVAANGLIAPNLVVIAFKCDSEAMDYFNNRIIRISELEHNLMAQIIIEARQGFSSPLNNPYLKSMTRSAAPPFGCEQLIKVYLEQILISLIRRETLPGLPLGIQPPAKSVKQKNDMELYNRIVDYLHSHIHTRLTIEQICKDNLVGHSQLQRLFIRQNNSGIMEYFSILKIERAKQLIRDQHYNFTQIADGLGYTSIHYFSRQFKRLTGMTPSEYSYSIKALSERSEK